MNDSPGWATPGSSPSDGERPGAPADQPAQPAQPAADPRWSAQQPPPGQWQSPAPQTPPPPQPGGQGWGQQPGTPYGGQYGYPAGPGQWGQWKPPAAKPGVIPLRPLGLGEILDGAVATMRTHWRSVLPITLVVATAVQVVSLLAQKYAMADLALTSDTGADAETSLNNLGTTLTLLGATLFITALGSLVATAMLTMIYSRAVLGTPSTVATAWREARPQLLRLLGLTLLLGIGGILLFVVLLLPGILGTSPGLIILGAVASIPLIVWLAIKFILASPALMLEKSTVFKSLTRSSKLVKGTWWRIFGITALTSIITGIVSAIIVWPLTIVGMVAFGGGLTGIENGTASTAWGALIFSGIGAIIAQTITMPIQSGVTVLLYVDQRIRREGLDLELARAAGVENYGTTGG
ncbi:glycerophosphoryl diester phosphodiesterase membrane domain-containing protein [Streptomyces sp. NPDC048337]|uniref:glycerophosphoryl diester phosphodiesterase membrane domain-containing protein n=1 Tax=Streptomyces sp. NPDC048337 TaxID=3365535 RepID=UPI00371C367B